MLSPPKVLLGFAAMLQTLRAAQRWKRRGQAAADQQEALQGWLVATAGTAFGRDHELRPGMTFAEFQRQVPLRTYAQFLPYLERMRGGAPDVLLPGECTQFARTAGTATGEAKLLPFPAALQRHFARAAREVLCHYVHRAGHPRVYHGRHLLLGSCTEPAAGPARAEVADASGWLLRDLPRTVGTRHYEPGPAVARLPESPARWAALADRVRDRRLTLIAGQPHSLLQLADALTPDPGGGRGSAPSWQSHWPVLECILHGGTSLAPYADELRQRVGPRARFHEVYAATEGCFATQDSDAPGELRLLTAAGVFFEFLPVTEAEPERLAAAGTKTLSLDQVECGRDYVLVITTPGGLGRYVLDDAVRLLSKDPPRVRLLPRLHLSLNTVGERLSEAEITHALVVTCQRQAWRIVNFHAAPIFLPTPQAPTGQPAHEWWVELKPGTVATPTGPALAVEIDAELQRTCESYRQRRRAGSLHAPVVRLVMPGLFAQWLHERGLAGPQQKVPRCRNDRDVADALARLAPFSAH